MKHILIKIENSSLDLTIRKIIENYTKETTTTIKVETAKITNEYADICILDVNNYFRYRKKLAEYPNISLIVINDTHNMKITYASNLYILNYPLVPEQLFMVLTRIFEIMKKENVVAQIPYKGEVRVNLQILNFIDIERRNLGYHTSKGVIKGKTMRTSFEKETQEYMAHKELYLIKPSFLVNLDNIHTLYPDHIEFYSKEILYFPKTAYKALQEKWKEYIS